MNIGELIRKEMKKYNKTQAEVARAVGLDRSTISKYINGKVNIPNDVFKKIATAVNSPILIKKAFGTTQTNVVFDIDYNKFYEILHRAKLEAEELIEQINRVMMNCYNTNHINDMSQDKINIIEDMMMQTESTNNSCDILDIACHVRGFSLEKRNRRWKQKKKRKYNLLENRIKRRETTSKSSESSEKNKDNLCFV